MKIPEGYDETLSNSFAPLPPGDYQCVIEKCEHIQSKRNGNWMYAITLGVMGTKRKLFDYILTSDEFYQANPKSLPKRVSFLKAVGAMDSSKPGDEIPNPNAQTLEAKEVWCIVLVDRNDPNKNSVFRYFRNKPEKNKPSATKQYTAAVNSVAKKERLADEEIPF